MTWRLTTLFECNPKTDLVQLWAAPRAGRLRRSTRTTAEILTLQSPMYSWRILQTISVDDKFATSVGMVRKNPMAFHVPLSNCQFSRCESSICQLHCLKRSFPCHRMENVENFISHWVINNTTFACMMYEQWRFCYYQWLHNIQIHMWFQTKQSISCYNTAQSDCSVSKLTQEGH